VLIRNCAQAGRLAGWQGGGQWARLKFNATFQLRRNPSAIFSFTGTGNAALPITVKPCYYSPQIKRCDSLHTSFMIVVV